MREKSACAALKRTPSANGGAVPALDHLSIARRSAQADDHTTKTLLFEVPYNEIRTHLSLNKDAPVSRTIERTGHILCRPILGGLHHQYARI